MSEEQFGVFTMDDMMKAVNKCRAETDAVEEMALRDYFAAQAMEGKAEAGDEDPEYWVGIADNAYRLADAMLEARKCD